MKIYKAFFFILLICSCGLNGIVILNSDLNAEEAGYNDEFYYLLYRVSDEAYELVEAKNKVNMMYEIQSDEYKEYKKAMKNNLKQLKRDSKKYLAKLKNTYPPETMVRLHNELIELLSSSINESHPENIYEQSKDFYIAIKHFEESLEHRENKHKIEVPVSLTFKPNFAPVSVGYSRGKFSVSLSHTTPVGSFSLGKSSAKGIKKLIIIASGKRRYFSLDRPFKFYIPDNYGIEISLEENEELIIEVIQKSM